MTLTQGRGSDIDKHKFAFLQDKVRTTHLITTNLVAIYLVMFITRLDFGGILLENFCQIFFLKNWMCFYKNKHFWMVGPSETKRRCIGWILGKLCDLDLWPDPWSWPCSVKVKFEIALFEEWEGLIDMGRNVIIHAWPWPWPMGNLGMVGGCTVQWLGGIQTSTCRRHT